MSKLSDDVTKGKPTPITSTELKVLNAGELSAIWGGRIRDVGDGASHTFQVGERDMTKSTGARY